MILAALFQGIFLHFVSVMIVYTTVPNFTLLCHRVVNIAVLVLLPIVSSILFACSIETGIGNIFSLTFCQYSTPILLSSGACNSVNNITVPERVIAKTVVLHLN